MVVQEVPVSYKSRLPEIRFWSDAVWLTWKEIAGKDAGDLKYIIRANIYTEASKEMMEMVGRRRMGRKDVDWKPPVNHKDWLKFRPNNDQDKGFYALLKTAHAKGVYQLVQQHQQTLRGRHIESITMLSTYNEQAHFHQWHMLFTLSEEGKRTTGSEQREEI